MRKTRLFWQETSQVLNMRSYKEIGMMDMWRELHPLDKCFTFFSHPHSVYSRIGYFFMFNSQGHRIIYCEIGVRTISDHAGVYLTLYLDNKPKAILWRLSTSLLNDPQKSKVYKDRILKII